MAGGIAVVIAAIRILAGRVAHATVIGAQCGGDSIALLPRANGSVKARGAFTGSDSLDWPLKRLSSATGLNGW